MGIGYVDLAVSLGLTVESDEILLGQASESCRRDVLSDLNSMRAEDQVDDKYVSGCVISMRGMTR